MNAANIVALDPEGHLKRKIRAHLHRLGFEKADNGSLVLPGSGKDVIRGLHRGQRDDIVSRNKTFLAGTAPKLMHVFADGKDLDPARIELHLIKVASGTREADIFRLASLTWSVPVSAGFGRRMRYLVWDRGHDKLAGIFALGDPVFNLAVRDVEIGWNVSDRSSRLVNLMDAYVLGAVPPYNMLLGGKAVACLIRSREVYDDFTSAYSGTQGIISGKTKDARLLVVTTTSSMGRSSIYNRLKLGNETYFKPLGYTTGFGHFHINDELFGEMRNYLRKRDHRYADEHMFGRGPNWRLRTIRAAIESLGLNKAILKHGIKRQVFICNLARNSAEILRTGDGEPDIADLRTAAEISWLARERWIIPRSKRHDHFRAWLGQCIMDMILTEGPDPKTDLFEDFA